MDKNIVPPNSSITLKISFDSERFCVDEESNIEPYGVFDYAYMDIEKAPVEFIKKILRARNEIIFHRSWTVDRQCYLIKPDGNRESLPEFYDLFPDDWATPKSADMLDGTLNELNRAVGFNGNVALARPSSTVITPSFYNFTAGTRDVGALATSLPGNNYNIGFTDSSGNSIGYKENLNVNNGIAMTPSSGSKYGVRASTYSTTGNAYMRVAEII